MKTFSNKSKKEGRNVNFMKIKYVMKSNKEVYKIPHGEYIYPDA